jgi:hypothetical protein
VSGDLAPNDERAAASEGQPVTKGASMRKLISTTGSIPTANARATAVAPVLEIVHARGPTAEAASSSSSTLRAATPAIAPPSDRQGFGVLFGGDEPRAARAAPYWTTKPLAVAKVKPSPPAPAPARPRREMAKPGPKPGSPKSQTITLERELAHRAGGAVAVDTEGSVFRYTNTRELRRALQAVVDQLMVQVALHEHAIELLDVGRDVGECDRTPLHGPSRKRIGMPPPRADRYLGTTDRSDWLHEHGKARSFLNMRVRENENDRSQLDVYSTGTPAEVEERDAQNAAWLRERGELRDHGECSGVVHGRACGDCGLVVARCELHGGIRGATNALLKHRERHELDGGRDDT